MSMAVISHLVQSYGYMAVIAFIALESIGIPLPGETTLIAAAVYAGSTHRLNIGAVVLVASIAAIVGDNIGYWLGARSGMRLVRRFGHLVRLDARKLNVGRYLFARHGGKVVFFGRFVVALRTCAAFFAGLNGMRPARFVLANAAGGVAWASAVGFGAYALGSAAIRVGSALTIGGLVAAGVLTVGFVLVVRRSMRVLERRAEAAHPEPIESASQPAGAR